MRTARVVCESNVYHVVARGVGKQIIFEDDADRVFFLKLLKRFVADRGELIAWCLMDNHFHLLVRFEMEQLSKAMRCLLSHYAMYFNERHGRVGHLFQGRFASTPVETDDQLLRTVRYIHQNPQKACMAQAQYYRWSSYGEYCGESGLCSTGLVLEMLGGVEGFVSLHDEEEQECCFDIGGAVVRLPADKLLATAREVLGDVTVEGVASLPKPKRDEKIRILKAAGFTGPQIQRITGLGRGVVAKA